MSTMFPTRMIGLVVAVVIAAGACSSAPPATEAAQSVPTPAAAVATTAEPDQQTPPVPTPKATTAPVREETSAGPSTTPAPPTIDLVAVTVDKITSVAPQGWTEASPGVFVGEGALIGFGAMPSAFAPDPADDGLELVEQLRIADHDWDLYAVDAGDAKVLVPVTEIGDMTYVITLQVPVDLADHYIDSVGLPALEAFEVDTSEPTYDRIQIASVAVDGRTTAYASGGSDGPTVVFEAGLDADGMDAWLAVADEAAAFSMVFAYDRAGVGGSDLSDAPRDGLHLVDELRIALTKSGHEPPYVLVGHSLGGMIIELFARTYPHEVTGLVIVDGRPASYTERCVERLGTAACVEDDELIDQYPEPYRSELLSMSVTEQQLRAAAPLGPIATVVIASPQSDAQPQSDAVWMEVQHEYATALNAELVVAKNSGHYIQYDEPHLVLQAIQRLVENPGTQ